jgi:hypothetical protein
MLAALRSFVKRHIVEEVPDEMSACLECGRLDCRDSTYVACPNRLRRKADLQALRAPAEKRDPPAQPPGDETKA